MGKLIYYLLKKAERSTKEIKVGLVSEAIGHTPVDSKPCSYNTLRHLQGLTAPHSGTVLADS